MKRGRRFLNSGIIFIFLLVAFMTIGTSRSYAGDFAEVEKILGAPGQMQEGAMIFSFPRQDLKIKIGRDPVP